MPANGFPFAVRVSCEIYSVGLFGLFAKGREKLSLASYRYVFGLIIVLNIDTHLTFREVAHMALAGDHLVIRAQELLDCFGFCG